MIVVGIVVRGFLLIFGILGATVFSIIMCDMEIHACRSRRET